MKPCMLRMLRTARKQACMHARPCVVQGPHWWDECPYPPKGACTAPPNGDFDGYVGLFEKGAAQIAQHPTAVCGEASSNTFTGVFTYVR